MTDHETAGAKWFREDKARREKEAADALRAYEEFGGPAA
jgi:Asp-tRNA(Asn)/Glu-tRNA(Gln) amidotransferase C subunit